MRFVRASGTDRPSGGWGEAFDHFNIALRMVVYVVLFLMIFYNLFNVITEESTAFYKDFRFWLVFASLLVLIWILIQSYPA